MTDPLTIYAAGAAAVFVAVLLTSEGSDGRHSTGEPSFIGAVLAGIIWPLGAVLLLIVLAMGLVERRGRGRAHEQPRHDRREIQGDDR